MPRQESIVAAEASNSDSYNSIDFTVSSDKRKSAIGVSQWRLAVQIHGQGVAFFRSSLFELLSRSALSHNDSLSQAYLNGNKLVLWRLIKAHCFGRHGEKQHRSTSAMAEICVTA